MPSRASGPQTASAACEREAADEDAELGEQPLRRRVEQVVAPADRGAQRLLALRARRAGRTTSRSSRRVEAVEDLGGGEDLDPGGGELDRQRQPVEPRADLRDPLPRRRARARAAGRRRARGARTAPTAGSAASGPSASSCSAAIRSGARLVTTSFVSGEAASSGLSSRAASSTCSKLSTTTSASQAQHRLELAGRRVRGVVEAAPSATNRAPSGKSPPSRCASSSANRVLPIPPGPVSVSSRTSGRQQRDRGLEVLVAAEQRRRRRRQRRAPARGAARRRASGLERRVVARGSAPRAAAARGRGPARAPRRARARARR